MCLVYDTVYGVQCTSWRRLVWFWKWSVDSASILHQHTQAGFGHKGHSRDVVAKIQLAFAVPGHLQKGPSAPGPIKSVMGNIGRCVDMIYLLHKLDKVFGARHKCDALTLPQATQIKNKCAMIFPEYGKKNISDSWNKKMKNNKSTWNIHIKWNAHQGIPAIHALFVSTWDK